MKFVRNCTSCSRFHKYTKAREGFSSWLLFSATGRLTIPPRVPSSTWWGLLIAVTGCHRYLTSGTISVRSPSVVRRSENRGGQTTSHGNNEFRLHHCLGISSSSLLPSFALSP
jgi:hypothetical protein